MVIGGRRCTSALLDLPQISPLNEDPMFAGQCDYRRPTMSAEHYSCWRNIPILRRDPPMEEPGAN